MLRRSTTEGPQAIRDESGTLRGFVYAPPPADDGDAPPDPSKVTVTIDRALLEAWREAETKREKAGVRLGVRDLDIHARVVLAAVKAQEAAAALARAVDAAERGK